MRVKDLRKIFDLFEEEFSDYNFIFEDFELHFPSGYAITHVELVFTCADDNLGVSAPRLELKGDK